MHAVAFLHAQVRRFYRRFGLLGGGWLASLPIFSLAISAMPSWYRLRTRSMVKVRSWRGHSWPPEASLTAFESLRPPSALVKRGPAS